MRSPVATLVGMVAEDMSRQEILQAYPDLEPEDIRERCTMRRKRYASR